MKAVPLELKKAIAIGIGLFIAFIGLYNSGLITKAAAPGLPVELGSFTTWPVFTTIVGLVSRSCSAHGATAAPSCSGSSPTTSFALIVNKATDYDAGFTAGAVWPSDIVSQPNFSLLGEFSFGALRHSASSPRSSGCSRCSCRTSSTRWARSSASASPPATWTRTATWTTRSGRCSSTHSPRWPAAQRPLVRHDVHRVGRRRRGRRPHGLDERRHGRAVLPVPLPRAADRDGSAAGDGARADHRRLAADQLAAESRRSRRGRDRPHRRKREARGDRLPRSRDRALRRR